jgi:hypothetical protein
VITRSYVEQDNEKLKEIHEKYFAREFEFPDFLKGYLCAFVTEDNCGNLVTAAGVRTLAEVVLVTNLRLPVKQRRAGLMETLNASRYIAEQYQFDSLHAFVQNDIWRHQLLKHGFQDCKGKPVFIGV